MPLLQSEPEATHNLQAQVSLGPATERQQHRSAFVSPGRQPSPGRRCGLGQGLHDDDVDRVQQGGDGVSPAAAREGDQGKLLEHQAKLVRCQDAEVLQPTAATHEPGPGGLGHHGERQGMRSSHHSDTAPADARVGQQPGEGVSDRQKPLAPQERDPAGERPAGRATPGGQGRDRTRPWPKDRTHVRSWAIVRVGCLQDSSACLP
jgi:hypothetical protein